MGIYYTVVGKIKSMGKSIAMLQSNHRNASFVHSHIAVLQFAFFSFAHRIVFSPHPEGAVEPIKNIVFIIGYHLKIANIYHNWLPSENSEYIS